jgi:hypothetical protein
MDSFINPKMFENLQKFMTENKITPPSSSSSSYYSDFCWIRNCCGGGGRGPDGQPSRHCGQALQTVFLQLFLQSLQAIKATGTMGRALSSSPSAARLCAS